MLFSVEVGKELIGGVRGFCVVQWTGIERHHTSQELHGKYSLFFFRQGFESIQKLSGLTTHSPRVTVFTPIDKGT